MAADCRAASRNLGLQSRLERAARAAVAPAPSLRFDDYPAEVGKREIRVSDAAARHRQRAPPAPGLMRAASCTR